MRWPPPDDARFARNAAEVIDDLLRVERTRARRLELIAERVRSAIRYGRRSRFGPETEGGKTLVSPKTT